eukprot:766862-Hanusia_phi.AAC.5
MRGPGQWELNEGVDGVTALVDEAVMELCQETLRRAHNRLVPNAGAEAWVAEEAGYSMVLGTFIAEVLPPASVGLNPAERPWSRDHCRQVRNGYYQNRGSQ